MFERKLTLPNNNNSLKSWCMYVPFTQEKVCYNTNCLIRFTFQTHHHSLSQIEIYIYTFVVKPLNVHGKVLTLSLSVFLHFFFLHQLLP